MSINQPVFRDAGHALHVSYLIHSTAPRTVSPTAIVIDQLVKENHVWDGVPVRTEGGVNFAGLSPLEIRGQCAQVVAMVAHLPHEAERYACQATYGYRTIKADGVRGLARYVSPMLSNGSEEFAKFCAWHVFATARQRDGMSQGDIAAQFGATVAAVREACAVIRRHGRMLHVRALDSLTERFLAGGLILDAAIA